MTGIVRWYAMRGTQLQFCTISAMDDYPRRKGSMKPYYFVEQSFLGNWGWELRSANHKTIAICTKSFESKKKALEDINKFEALIKSLPECKGRNV